MHLPDQLPPQKRAPAAMLALLCFYYLSVFFADLVRWVSVSHAQPRVAERGPNRKSKKKNAPRVVADDAAKRAAADAEPLRGGGRAAEERVSLPIGLNLEWRGCCVERCGAYAKGGTTTKRKKVERARRRRPGADPAFSQKGKKQNNETLTSTAGAAARGSSPACSCAARGP